MYIPLDQVPDIETLVVTYVVGDKSFPLPGGAGFTFDEQDNIIQIHGDHPVIVENPGGEIKIDFTPINWKRLKKDHVKRFGEN